MNDGTIIRNIARGDSNGIDVAINKYSKLVWHIAIKVLRPVGSPEDIEECVADVFIYLWQNHDKYNSTRGSLKTWLSTVAKSKAIDKYRQLTRENIVPLNDEVLNEAIGFTEVLSDDSKRGVLAAINALTEPDREIIIRRFYYNQKPKDIAFALGLPVKQIENRLYRSKQKLRNTIAIENGGF